MMNVLINGENVLVDVVLIKSIEDSTVTIAINNEEKEINVDDDTVVALKEILEETEDALIPFDVETNKFVTDAVPLDESIL